MFYEKAQFNLFFAMPTTFGHSIAATAQKLIVSAAGDRDLNFLAVPHARVVFALAFGRSELISLLVGLECKLFVDVDMV